VELTVEAGVPLEKEAIVAGLAVSDSSLYVGERFGVGRFDKAVGTYGGRQAAPDGVTRVRVIGTDVYWTTSAGVFRVSSSVWASAPVTTPVLAGATDDVTAAVGRVFASQAAQQRIIEIGGQGSVISSSEGPRGVGGNDMSVYWAIAGNVRRAYQGNAASLKLLLEPTLLPSTSTPSIALDGPRLAVATDRGGGCSSVHVVNASTLAGTVDPSFTIERTPRAGDWLVADSGWAFWTTGARIVGVDLATGTKRVFASGLSNCAAGLAADSTHVYVACANRRVFRATR
jgi:hypothetical protein